MTTNPVSSVNVAGHPLHPMLIPFPIAFLVGALASDLAFWGTGNPFFAQASMWLIGAGIVMGALAAIAGLIDFLGDKRIRDLSDAWQHFLGNGTVIVLALINFGLRYAQGAEAAIKPWGLVYSFLIAGGLLFTGWKGGEMVFRSRVAVYDAPEQTGAPRQDNQTGRRHAA